MLPVLRYGDDPLPQWEECRLCGLSNCVFAFYERKILEKDCREGDRMRRRSVLPLQYVCVNVCMIEPKSRGSQRDVVYLG